DVLDVEPDAEDREDPEHDRDDERDLVHLALPFAPAPARTIAVPPNRRQTSLARRSSASRASLSTLPAARTRPPGSRVARPGGTARRLPCSARRRAPPRAPRRRRDRARIRLSAGSPRAVRLCPRGSRAPRRTRSPGN